MSVPITPPYSPQSTKAQVWPFVSDSEKLPFRWNCSSADGNADRCWAEESLRSGEIKFKVSRLPQKYVSLEDNLCANMFVQRNF